MASDGEDPDELFGRAQELATDYRHADAEELLAHILRLLGSGASPAGLTRERVLVTLAMVRAELGRVVDGLEILDRLEPDATGALRAVVLSQRGLLHLRAGRVAEALSDLDAAVPLQPADSPDLARNLLNRGWVHLSLGELALARRDLQECTRVAAAAQRPLLEARAGHNLGYLSFLAGDLPRALAEMDAAHARITALADPALPPEPHPVYHLDRARVLLAAGLLAEADAGLGEAAAGFAAIGVPQDEAECELARAQVALSQGRWDDAVARASRARAGFRHRQSTAWARLAELVVLRARHERGDPAGRIAVAAGELAGQLAADGLGEDARMARLLSARAGLEADRRRGRRPSPETPAVPLRRDDSILTRLYCRQVRAIAADVGGQPRQAARELRAGLRELHRYQAGLGSLDLQTAVTRHGVSLASGGLAASLRDGTAGEVFAWSEQGRALASRLPPVRPPDDPEAADLLEQLRFVRTELRTLVLGGQDDPRLRTRQAELERRIRQRSWHAPGSGDVARPVSAAAVRRALAAGDGAGSATMVTHLESQGRLHALVIRPGGLRVVELGPADEVWESLRRARADLDVLALRGVVPAMRRTVLRSLARDLDRLDDRLWRPVHDLTGDGTLVLVPPGALTAVPWSMLPRLRGRSVTVARSATTWWRTLRPAGAPAATVPAPRAPSVVFAAGPHLDRAEDEVRQAASGWPSATVLTGERASGPAVLAAMGRSDLVHLAAHGAHEAANALFSAVQLADGPLFGYDLARVPRLPDQVVLSACDLGLATERPGDELLGMTAALLQGGTRCVVAAVARICDDVALEVTVGYHRGLQAGLLPAQALAAAVEHRPDAPFVCFGNGW